MSPQNEQPGLSISPPVPLTPVRHGRRLPGANGQVLKLLTTNRVRFSFILTALVFLALSAFCLILMNLIETEPTDTDNDPTEAVNREMMQKLGQLLNENRAAVTFLTVTFIVLQFVAVLAATRGWSVVLFTYVIITGLFGMIVGIIGVIGLVLAQFVESSSLTGKALPTRWAQSDHPVGLICVFLILFIMILYTLTVLGLKLIELFRKNKERNRRFLRRQTGYHNRLSSQPMEENAPQNAENWEGNDFTQLSLFTEQDYSGDGTEGSAGLARSLPSKPLDRQV